jgi:hypothetical protein
MKPRRMLDGDWQTLANRDAGSYTHDVQQLARVLWNVAANTPNTADQDRDESRTGAVARLRLRLGRKPNTTP